MELSGQLRMVPAEVLHQLVFGFARGGLQHPSHQLAAGQRRLLLDARGGLQAVAKPLFHGLEHVRVDLFQSGHAAKHVGLQSA